MREVLTRDFIEINPAHFNPLPGGLLIDSDWTRSGFQLYHDNNLISAPSSPVHKEKERKREREEEKREEGRRFFGIGFFFSFYF